MKKIVIIGGGFAGTACARKLEKNRNFQVTLIDNKDYFEFTPGILRTIVEPSHINKIQAYHKDYLKKTAFLNNHVLEISKNKIKTKKRVLDFDYLIITSGSRYESPIKEQGIVRAFRAKELADCHEKLNSSSRVLIIGGGLVGVELAAEIVEHYDDKEITIINSGKHIISRNHPKAIAYAQNFLTKLGVKVISEERVKTTSPNYCITSSGKKVACDLIFLCTGIKSNFEFMKKNFKKHLNKLNQIIVNSHLQLNEHPNIFVGGDITNIPEEKTAQTAEAHANLIVKNILLLEKNKPLKDYKSKHRPMVISLGKHDAILDTGKIVITGFIPTFLKNFVEWKTMRKIQ